MHAEALLAGAAPWEAPAHMAEPDAGGELPRPRQRQPREPPADAPWREELLSIEEWLGREYRLFRAATQPAHGAPRPLPPSPRRLDTPAFDDGMDAAGS